MDAYSLNQITSRLDRLITIGEAIMAHLERLELAVAEVETAGASIITLLNGIAAELRDIKEGGSAEVEAFAARLEAKAEALKTAVFENTQTEDDEEEPEDPTLP